MENGKGVLMKRERLLELAGIVTETHYSVEYKGITIDDFDMLSDEDAINFANARFSHYDELVNNKTDKVIATKKKVEEGVQLNEDQSFREAIKVIAAELLSHAHLEEFDSGEIDGEQIIGELLDGSWIHQLGDEIRDQLFDRKKVRG